MKSNSYISIKESPFLLITASLVFFLTVINLGSIIYTEFLSSLRSSGIDFSNCGVRRINLIPYFRFFALLIFPLLIWKKKAVFSILFTFLSFSGFTSEIYRTFGYISLNEVKISFFELISYNITQIDFIVFSIISLLLFWQISILLRMLIKSLQRKPELP